MDKLMTFEEAAERLGTTPRHMRRLVVERRMAYRKLGRYVLSILTTWPNRRPPTT